VGCAPDASFHEVRYFKRGNFAQWFAALSVVAVVVAIFVDAYRPAVALFAVVLFIPFLLRFETCVDGGELRAQVRPLWRRTIRVDDIVATELTIWDGQVGFFGGFSTRRSVAGALMSSWEGDTSVGNRAIVLTLQSGKQHQLGTFRPKALTAAHERAAGRSLQTDDPSADVDTDDRND
jgi:hypothetical protein